MTIESNVRNVQSPSPMMTNSNERAQPPPPPSSQPPPPPPPGSGSRNLGRTNSSAQRRPPPPPAQNNLPWNPISGETITGTFNFLKLFDLFESLTKTSVLFVI